MKLDRPRPERFNAYFSLSIELARSGTSFGSDTQYGECVWMHAKMWVCAMK